ncbi:MAG: UvrD-helicase domain-containing protein [Anaerolineae bacterium]|nr:UvrD-helicase domain-containing protein [Anaerolineae bacterium]
MNLTPDQHAAIHTHDRNLVVVAGAGSGKTFVLVERYLALLDANPDWALNQLVAITFTQKAAQEMRDRVRMALDERLQDAHQHNDAEAISLWSARVSAMDSARIDTIHALCAAILRQNAAEAGIDPAFEVLDEMGARILLETVLDDLFADLALNNDPAIQLFRVYGARDIRQSLIDHIAVSVNPPPEDVYERWCQAWNEVAADSIRALLADETFAAAADWQPPGGFPTGDDAILRVWQTCLMHLGSLRRSDDFAVQLSALDSLSSAINLQGGGAKIWGSKEAVAESRAQLRIIRDSVRNVLADIGDPPNEHDEIAASLLPLWASLLRRAHQVYSDAKYERSALDFDDLESYTRTLLTEHPPIRARYQRGEFKHLLVDEFQDTSDTQWQIVRSLADPETPGALFIVGDAKQSIYAFRGADVRVFDQARAHIGRVGGSEVTLARSFRTHAPLVGFFNNLFSHLLVRETGSLAAEFQVEMGRPMEAARDSAPDDAPCVELLLIDRNALPEGEEDKAIRARRLEAATIARRIHAMVAQEVLVYDRKLKQTRPIRYDDCALLFRAMRDAPLYEDVFKDMELPFVTVAGRGYYERQEVWDILNLLRALHNPGDHLSLAAALRSPLFALSDDALFALRSRQDDTGQIPRLWDALADPDGVPEDEHARLRYAQAVLTDLQRLAGRVTIAELIDAALDATHYLALLTGLPDGARRRSNIEKLVEKARMSGHTTLGEFTRYLADLTQLEAREGEASLDSEGSVTLMTVHKSKGLEFPVVFLVDASREGGGGQGNVVMHDGAGQLACKVYDDVEAKAVETFAYRRLRAVQRAREDAESRRLLYVAATRAQDRLIVSGQAARKNDGNWSASGWLGTLLNLLELNDWESDGTLTFDWGQMAISIVGESSESPTPAAASSAAQTDVWHLPDVTPQMPPLMASVELAADAPARSLTATQIANLGAFAVDLPHRSLYRQRLLRSFLHDTPERVARVVNTPQRVSGRRIGEIVHRALRAWKFPTDQDDLSGLLRGYAWEEGLVDPAEITEAVNEARMLLARIRHSDLYARVDEAYHDLRFYAEVPFVFQTDRRVIHGKIDALIRDASGAWAIIDYKSSTVLGGYREATLVDHARRYHLQMGVYASAVRRLLDGITPQVYIHYIRYNHTIQVATADWEAALDALESNIGDLLG